LRDYKIPDGNPENKFAFNNEIQDKDFALNIADEMHEEWVKLISGKAVRKEISLNGTGNRSANRMSSLDAENVIEAQQKKFVAGE